jgi:3-hydroxybutyryl-CoA dehydrogenase
VAGPERFLNAHWLNPAYLIPLVEVSAGTRTSEDTVEAVMSLLTEVGKVPVRCAASPGFIVPRLQSVAMNEAIRIVEEGVASAEDVDRAIRAGFGVRYSVLGLVEFVDWGGVDILHYAGNYLAKALDNPRYQPPPSVAEKMRTGKKGMHAGEGYYDFRGVDLNAYQHERLARFVSLLRHLDLMPGPAKD